LAVAAVVGYLVSVGFAAAAEGPAPGAMAPPVDHSNHVHQEAAAGTTMDAAGDHDHGDHQDHATASGDDDPHAQHKAMMRQQGYQRSEHAYTLEDLPLVGMDGKPTSLRAELDADKPVMVNFVFTTCTTICPVMTGIFAQVQKQLGPERDDVRMISVSIDPEYDTPERLREYAKRFNAGPQWRFLTGDLRNIIGVQRAFDVYRGNKMSHEPTTLMRRSSGDPWVRLDGIASAADITSEYRALVGR
jgi:protein SCO1/2